MKRIGFTMIELLVVIAIIAVLAAIIFPAAMRAKDAAYRGSDMSHMNELRSALQLYRVDQGGYPPELFGYVTPYGTAPTLPITAADQTIDFLFPKRVSSFQTFQPAEDHSTSTDTVPQASVGQGQCSYSAGVATGQNCAVWPGAPIASPSTGCKGRAYGADTPVTTDPLNPADSSAYPVYFYQDDGYDVAPVKNTDGTTRYEIHYALFWSGYGLGISGCTTGGLAGNAADDTRQLGYANPPDTTVVTWDTFFRDYDGNVPVKDKRDIVLFIGGNAKMFSSAQVDSNPWTVSP